MTEEIKAYCMKCKAERTIQNVQIVTTKNGRPAANGTCPVCGTKMFKFLPSSYKAMAAPASVAETAPAAPVAEPPAAPVAEAPAEPAPEQPGA
jgi:predicted  nucleic acid-binding Zn-ribbon protein